MLLDASIRFYKKNEACVYIYSQAYIILYAKICDTRHCFCKALLV